MQGSRSCRAVRGGDVSTYEKAPTGSFFAWRLLPLPGTPILGRLRGRYRGDECARVGSLAGGLWSSGENGGLDGGIESFAELSWLGLGHRGRMEFYSVQASQTRVEDKMSVDAPDLD
ncbi:hypothetical protein Taro_048234 [Colocasia esculenta]|uniref:Uncharacterized protein n=1 Tax=Colocasia esculenta TaxID=4460 RepID=A0A843WXL8_COLES|nr:hypothetical protein [Colocasia esculenta]